MYAVLTLGFTIKSPPSSSIDVLSLYIVSAFFDLDNALADLQQRIYEEEHGG